MFTLPTFPVFHFTNPLKEEKMYDYYEDEYSGTYAYDVEGYTDDEIDTIFDGDPEAYWNID